MDVDLLSCVTLILCVELKSVSGSKVHSLAANCISRAASCCISRARAGAAVRISTSALAAAVVVVDAIISVARLGQDEYDDTRGNG